MTDIMSEAFGRELAARTTFEKEGIWLPLLAVHAFNAGETVIADKVFTDCVIEGPALMAVLGGVTFEACNLGIATDPRSLFYKAHGPMLAGVIPLARTRFIQCRFVQVGFTGQDAIIDAMAGGLLSSKDVIR